ncbi:MAG: spore coat protein [Clostridia bacterium]|jgi:spore coat protein CotF|nr:spore coat protein [Clostridia bacterium]
MEDKDLIEKELLIIKGVCDLYLHGTIESSTAEVHEAFKCALNESLNIQNKIYNLMAEKGWYQMENVEQQKIDAAKQKFAAQ